MRMVKLVGDLPGFTYVLSYDRRPVVAALSGDGIRGDQYLEKIVQVEHRVPQVVPELLARMLAREIEDSTARRLDGDASGRWPEIFAAIVVPLIRTPRDVRRYGNAVRLSLDLHGAEVDVVDQLALAALATFAPHFHMQLPGLAGLLLKEPEPLAGLASSRSHIDAANADLKAAAESAPGVAEATYLLLFPATGAALGQTLPTAASADEALRCRRVADVDAFWAYFTAAVPDPALSMLEVRRVIAAFGEPELKDQLSRLDLPQLTELLNRLRVHAVEVAPEAAGVAAQTIVEHVRNRGGKFSEWGGPGGAAIRLACALVEQLSPPDRGQFLETWATSTEDVLTLFVVCELGRAVSLDGAPHKSAHRTILQMRLAATAVSADLDALFDLADAKPILHATFEVVEQADRAALRRLLDADDRLFAHYLSRHSDDRGPFRWGPLKETVGEAWLFERIDNLASDFETGDPVLERTLRAVRTLRHKDGERAR
jgi:KAP family P-loop domain